MKNENAFVLCISNEGYTASLERRKLYRVIEDEKASTLNMLRIIDESGDDYLFPATLFAALHLPSELEAQLLQAA